MNVYRQRFGFGVAALFDFFVIYLPVHIRIQQFTEIPCNSAYSDWEDATSTGRYAGTCRGGQNVAGSSRQCRGNGSGAWKAMLDIDGRYFNEARYWPDV